MAFDAGNIDATLTLDREPFSRELHEAIAEADDFSARRFEASLSLDTSGLRAEAERAAREALMGLGGNVGLGLDSTGLRTQVTDALNAATIGQMGKVGITLDSSGLRESVRVAVDEASVGQTIKVNVDAIAEGLRDRVRSAVDEAGMGEDIHVGITLDSTSLRSQVSDALDVATMGQMGHVGLNLDSSGLREAVRIAVDEAGAGQTIKVNVDVESAGLREHIRALVAEAGIGEDVHVGVDVDKSSADRVNELSSSFQGLNASALPMPGLMALAAGAIIGLGPALIPVTGLLATMPALLIGAGAGFAAIKLSSDALKQSFQQLTPEMDKLKTIASQNLMPGVDAGIKSLTPLFPVLEQGIRSAASAIGDFARQLGTLLGSQGFGENLSKIIDTNNVAFRALGTGVISLIDGIVRLTAAAGPLITWMSQGIEKSLALFNAWTKSAEASGSLARGFEVVREATSALVYALGGIVNALGAVFLNDAVVQGSIDLVSRIGTLTNSFAAWARSAEGSRYIADIFDFIKGAVIGAATALEEIGRIVLPVVAAFLRFNEAHPAVAQLVGQVGLLALAVSMLAGPIGAVVSVITTLGGAVSSLIPALGGASAAAEGAGAAATGLSLPLVAATAGIAAFGIAAVVAYQNIPAFRDGVNQAGSALADFGAKARTAVASGFSDLVANARPGFDALTAAVKDSFSKIGPVIADVVTSATKAFETILPAIKQTLGTLGDTIRPLLEVIAVIIRDVTSIAIELWQRFGAQLMEHIATAINAVLQIIRGGLEILKGVFEVILAVLTGDWGKAWDGIKDITRGVWDIISGLVKTGMNLVSTAIGAGAAVISEAWHLVWNTLSSFVGSIWSGIASVVSAGFRQIVDVFTTVGGEIARAWDAVWAKVKETVTTIWDAIRNTVSTGINAIASVISTIGNAIATAWHAVWDGLVAVVEYVWGVVKALIQANLTIIVALFKAGAELLVLAWRLQWDIIRDIALGVWQIIGGAVTAGLNAVLAVFTSIGHAISAVWTAIWDAIKSIVILVWDAIKTAVTVGITAVQTVIDVIGRGIQVTWNAIWVAIQAVIVPVWNVIHATVQTMWTAVLSVIQTVGAAISAVWNALWTAISAFLSATWAVMHTVVVTVWTAIQAVIAAIGGAISAAWNVMWTAISAFLTATWNIMHTTVVTIWTAIQNVMAAIGAAISAAWNVLWNAMSAFLQAAWNTMHTIVVTVWTAIQNVMNAIGAAIQAAWNALWNAISAFLSNIWNVMQGTVTNVWNAIHGVISSVGGAIEGTWNDLWNRMSGTLTRIWGTIKDTIQNVWNDINRVFRDGANVLADLINTVTGAINTVGSALGIHIDIPKVHFAQGGIIPAMAVGGEVPVSTVSTAQFGNIPGYQTGGGFVVNKPRAIVGEGSDWPEYVIPTDPKYRDRAQGLYGQLGPHLGMGAHPGTMDKNRNHHLDLAEIRGMADGGIIYMIPALAGGGVWASNAAHGVDLVQQNFPVTGSTYPGHEPDEAHAADFMCSPDIGNRLAPWAKDHASDLALQYIIWQQHIWNTAQAGAGWRLMEDRGSPTQNHMDHVHISWPTDGQGWFMSHVRSILADTWDAAMTPVKAGVNAVNGDGHGAPLHLVGGSLLHLIDNVHDFFAGKDKQLNGTGDASQSGTGSYTGGTPGTIGLEKAYAQQVLDARGLGNQFPSVDYIFTKESGWDPHSVNPSSGAAGIPQALGHGNVFSLDDWQAQINWGISYMIDRYGSPAGAEAFWRSHNWYKDGGVLPRSVSPDYYDTGGWAMPGYTGMMNATGQPEAVLNSEQWGWIRNLLDVTALNGQGHSDYVIRPKDQVGSDVEVIRTIIREELNAGSPFGSGPKIEQNINYAGTDPAIALADANRQLAWAMRR